MKLSKKLLAAGLLVSVAAGVAQAQSTLVAGWDFSQFYQSGINSTNAANGFAGAGVATANYSDQFNPSANTGASAFGSIYYDGTMGSTDSNPAVASASISPYTGNLSSRSILATDGSPFNAGSSYNLLTQSGQLYTNDLSLGIKEDNSIVVSADLSSTGQYASGWQLDFAGKMLQSGGTASIAWEYSLDGSAFSDLATTSNVTDVDAGFSIFGVAAMDTAAIVYFRGTVTGTSDTSLLLLDNIGISAAVVPEPSMMAAFLSLFAGVMVIARRRR